MQVVKWGGDPGNTVTFSVDRKKYHPRQSFQIWKEAVSLHSFPWKTQERIVAGNIRQAVTEALLDLRSAKLKTLSGIVPICSYCKKIRDENDSWRIMEEYIQTRSKAKFSHGICPRVLDPRIERGRSLDRLNRLALDEFARPQFTMWV